MTISRDTASTDVVLENTPPIGASAPAPVPLTDAEVQAARNQDYTARIARFRATGDETVLRPLVDDFSQRIERQSARYARGGGLDPSDVHVAGFTALASALQEYDLTAGVPFGVLFARHFAAKIKEQRAELEGALALRRKTFSVRSNVLVARDAVQKERTATASARGATGFARAEEVGRFTLPASFDDAQFGALFDAAGLDGAAGRPSSARSTAWATLFTCVTEHYRRALPDAPLETLERAAIAKTVPIANAPPISRSAMERTLADTIEYDLTMFGRRGAAYDPAPSPERATSALRDFYEAVGHRAGTTADRARALLESFGHTQSFDAAPDDNGGSKSGHTLAARLAAETSDELRDDDMAPLIHGLHLVPTVSRLAFVLHMGLDGFRPLSMTQLAHDCGLSVGQVDRLVSNARAVLTTPAIREEVVGLARGGSATPTRAAVADTVAQWYATREGARAEHGMSAGRSRTTDATERVTEAAQGGSDADHRAHSRPRTADLSEVENDVLQSNGQLGMAL